MKKRRSLQKQEGKSTDKEQAGPGRRTIHPRPHDGLGYFLHSFFPLQEIPFTPSARMRSTFAAMGSPFTLSLPAGFVDASRTR